MDGLGEGRGRERRRLQVLMTCWRGEGAAFSCPPREGGGRRLLKSGKSWVVWSVGSGHPEWLGVVDLTSVNSYSGMGGILR